MVDVLMLLIACHFIADFPFQGDWLGVNKGKSWELMFYHCAIYAGTFLIFAHASLLFAAVLFISHIIIDPMKARWKFIKHIWVDQILHIIVIIICIMINIT
jgi:hypothetical protein